MSDLRGVQFYPEWPIAELKPADYNPRRIQPDAFRQLRESLGTFGVVKPIILNKDLTIVAGHQRLKALTANGAVTAPCVTLPHQVGRQDEIRFNLMHNSIETDAASGRVSGKLSLGYQIIDPSRLEMRRGEGGASAVKEISKLVSRYGSWGSLIVAQSGDIIANADYAYAAWILQVPVLIYVLDDEQVPGLVAALSKDYGEYYYEPLEVKGYNQSHAQLNRLRGRRDQNGNLEDRSTDLASRIYTKLVIPHISKLNGKARLVDFGAGHGDHAKALRREGHSVFTYEPHLRVHGRQAIDSAGIVRSIRLLGRDVARHGLYPIVVLDSVLNSVTSLKFEDAVLTSVNALLSSDGVLFTNGRAVETPNRQKDAGIDTGSVRRIEFLDKDNFSATYRDGRWTLQHFHSLPDLMKLLREYFVSVEHVGSDNYHRVRVEGPRPLGEERYREALNTELNMEMPGGTFHNRHSEAVDAIVQAALERDAA